MNCSRQQFYSSPKQQRRKLQTVLKSHAKNEVLTSKTVKGNVNEELNKS